MQPYNNNGLDGIWLARLQDYSNPDKHRRLEILNTSNRVIHSWGVSLGNPIKGININYAVEASRYLSLDGVASMPVIPALESLRLHVEDTLARFAPDFP
jgi:hypothetical protein